MSQQTYRGWTIEPAFIGFYDDDQAREWRVYRDGGGINEREWAIVSRGQSVREVVIAAHAAFLKPAFGDKQ